jgi:hypothetical protein
MASVVFNGGAVSELTIGLMLLAHALIFYISLPSSFVVYLIFRLPVVSDLIATSKFQDLYLLSCMAVVGYLQWWLLIEPAIRAWERRRLTRTTP